MTAQEAFTTNTPLPLTAVEWATLLAEKRALRTTHEGDVNALRPTSNNEWAFRMVATLRGETWS